MMRSGGALFIYLKNKVLESYTKELPIVTEPDGLEFRMGTLVCFCFVFSIGIRPGKHRSS